jgi:hypothetical protein
MVDSPAATPDIHPEQRDVDFEVYREDWNVYQLEDGTRLKNRVILMKVMSRPQEEEGQEGRQYAFKTKMITTSARVPSHLKGTPDPNQYPPGELQEDSQRLDFDTLKEEWNEYVLPDKTRIRLKVNLVEVRRSPKFNADGDPIYLIATSNLFKMEPPE